MTDRRWVNAETLAAAPFDVPCLVRPGFVHFHEPCYQAAHQAFLAAIPPDPRLDALLAAARAFYTEWSGPMFDQGEVHQAFLDLRDALAAFEEKA